MLKGFMVLFDSDSIINIMASTSTSHIYSYTRMKYSNLRLYSWSKYFHLYAENQKNSFV